MRSFKLSNIFGPKYLMTNNLYKCDKVERNVLENKFAFI